MRIVFFGTGDFSTDILKGLIASNKQVVAVVSQPDKVNGRNNKTTFSTIKKYCVENNIPLYQFAKLNLEGESVLKELNPDIFITASYGQIIKQNILDIPRFGTINVHASLLPKYRGSAPIQWAIINGETKTGITIMRTELGLDTGDIYFSREIDVLEEDTLSSVFKKLATLGIECLDEFFNNFDYYINHHTKQNEAEASYYPMLKKEDYLLNFNQTSKQIFNRVRGLENCYFIYNNCRYKVLKVTINSMQGRAGEILSCNSKNGLIIATSDSAVKVEIIQPEGKQKMEANAYMNSNKFKLGDIIENS